MEGGLVLDIQVQEIFDYVSTLFSTFWPLLAFGLGVLVFPSIVRVAKSVIGR